MSATPVMQQYFEIKTNHKNSMVFFQVGDFFEVFEEDALILSEKLGLTLTKRGIYPMSGVPVQSLDFYLKKLLACFNKPIAICEQTETPDEAKERGHSIVSREVTRIITRGTYQDLISKENNFILTVFEKDDFLELCYADLSTGECFLEEIDSSMLLSEIYKINPSEIILIKHYDSLDIFEDIINIFDELSVNSSFELLTQYLYYHKISFNLKPVKQNSQKLMRLGQNTLRNLDIINHPQDSKFSLLGVLDATQTPEGYRILKHNLSRPLVDKKIIEQRMDAVEYFINHINKLGKIHFPRGDLKKLLNSKNNIKNLWKIGHFIQQSLYLLDTLVNKPTNLQKTFSLKEISEHIMNSISEEADVIGAGNCFSSCEKSKNLYTQKQNIFQQILNLPSKYNINCRIKNNNLIGFFFELTKANKSIVPQDFILKQGLATSSRYTNMELMNLEIKLKEIEQEILDLETFLFNEIYEQIQKQKTEIETFARYMGYLDYFHSLALKSIENNYYRPKFVENKGLIIENGRHPSMEKFQKMFIPNDLNFNKDLLQILITGPNMGGKSTYLRQNALMVFMAQCGMFVPGNYTGQIFTGLFVRIGTGDSLIHNESTFMIEMNECSEILRLANENSLIVLDEVGRGTSTNDGISICIAILEYLHTKTQCCSIISTHYHELSKCETYLNKFKNFKVDIFLEKDIITFLYKIIPGVAGGSFGINVARLAKLPLEVIDRSLEIFKNLN